MILNISCRGTTEGQGMQWCANQTWLRKLSSSWCTYPGGDEDVVETSIPSCCSTLQTHNTTRRNLERILRYKVLGKEVVGGQAPFVFLKVKDTARSWKWTSGKDWFLGPQAWYHCVIVKVHSGKIWLAPHEDWEECILHKSCKPHPKGFKFNTKGRSKQKTTQNSCQVSARSLPCDGAYAFNVYILM